MTRRTRLALVLAICLGALPLGRASGVAAQRMATATPCTWVLVTAPLALLGSDTNAYYWGALLTATPGLTLTITGTYPAARYASIQVYTGAGAYLTEMADKDFPPDPGVTNPFASGGARDAGTYTLHAVFAPPPASPAPGTLYIAQPAGTLIWLAYRIYLPDQNTAPNGTAPLPLVTAQASDGTSAACPQAWPKPGARPAPTPRVPLETLRPVQRAGTAPVFTRLSQGGIFTNIDAAYLTALLSPTSNLYVIRFKAPSTPPTLAGQPFDPSTQLRYWSLCVYTWADVPYTCLPDEQMPVDANGWVTAVLGPFWARPTNATAANGVAWISLNAFLLPYLAIVRNMLPAPGFQQSAFNVPPGSAASPATMGSYTPTITPCTKAAFEAGGCRS